MGHVLHLRHLIVVSQDDRVALLGQGSDLVLEALDLHGFQSAGGPAGLRVGSSMGFIAVFAL